MDEVRSDDINETGTKPGVDEVQGHGLDQTLRGREPGQRQRRGLRSRLGPNPVWMRFEASVRAGFEVTARTEPGVDELWGSGTDEV